MLPEYCNFHTRCCNEEAESREILVLVKVNQDGWGESAEYDGNACYGLATNHLELGIWLGGRLVSTKISKQENIRYQRQRSKDKVRAI